MFTSESDEVIGIVRHLNLFGDARSENTVDERLARDEC